jgi:hypothetical protein
VPQTATGQFLFAGGSASPLLAGFRINSDGSLAPLPGSPFLTGFPARRLQSLKGILMVETESAIRFYRVNRETGALEQQTPAAALSASDLARLATAGPQTAILDPEGKFMYMVDAARAELLAFRVEGQGLVKIAEANPVPDGTNSVALVKP